MWPGNGSGLGVAAWCPSFVVVVQNTKHSLLPAVVCWNADVPRWFSRPYTPPPGPVKGLSTPHGIIILQQRSNVDLAC